MYCRFVLCLILLNRADRVMRKQQGHVFLQQNEVAADQVCTFEVAAHVDGNGVATSSEHSVDASQKNIIWQGSEVMVVKSTSDGEESSGSFDHRYLAFRLPDGSCHEQAEQTCLVSMGESPLPTNRTDVASDKEGHCPPCEVPASAAPPLNYIRSMLGGTLSALGTMKALSSADRFLAIGLGSGALPLWAAQNFPGVKVEAVDLSAEVVLAAPCFGINSKTLGLHVADGRAFLAKQPEGTYDAIFVDAFDDQRSIPQCLSTLEFFEMVGRKLKPDGGVMALNAVPGGGGSNIKDLIAAIQATFMHVSVGTANGETNRLILASQMELDTTGAPKSADDDAAHTVAEWARKGEFVVQDRVGQKPSSDAEVLGGCAG